MLVLQYRPPMEQLNLEFPAGLIDEGETASEAAKRELSEETYVLIVCAPSPLKMRSTYSNLRDDDIADEVSIDAEAILEKLSIRALP